MRMPMRAGLGILLNDGIDYQYGMDKIERKRSLATSL
jgi:hypothetical protein